MCTSTYLCVGTYACVVSSNCSGPVSSIEPAEHRISTRMGPSLSKALLHKLLKFNLMRRPSVNDRTILAHHQHKGDPVDAENGGWLRLPRPRPTPEMDRILPPSLPGPLPHRACALVHGDGDEDHVSSPF